MARRRSSSTAWLTRTPPMSPTWTQAALAPSTGWGRRLRMMTSDMTEVPAPAKVSSGSLAMPTSSERSHSHLRVDSSALSMV